MPEQMRRRPGTKSGCGELDSVMTIRTHPSRPGGRNRQIAHPTGRSSTARAVPRTIAGYGRTPTSPVTGSPVIAREEGRTMMLLRQEIGDVLRHARQRQGRTLREVSSAARVSLGYLSEVERGQKEASSELLFAISNALNVPLYLVLREVSDRIAVAEGVQIPDTVPPELELLNEGLVGAR